MDNTRLVERERLLAFLFILLFGCLLFLPAQPTSAQLNLIAVYSDSTHTDCTLSTLPPHTFELVFWVFQNSAVGAQGARFKAPRPSCFMEYDWAKDDKPFPQTIGTSPAGVTISYGSCLTGWTHILTIHFYGDLGIPACCEFAILPHPQSSTGNIEVLDCAGNWVSADAESGFIDNDYALCPCSIPPWVPTHATTWGVIKALYE